MKKKILFLCSLVFAIIVIAGFSVIGALATETIAPCKMESELDVYAGAKYFSNLRNPIVKGGSFKVATIEWNINRFRQDYRECMSYGSQQETFAENTTYYLRVTLHSLDYPNSVFSSSTIVTDFAGFTLSLKVNGNDVVLSPHAVDNYDDTHEYIDLIYKVQTGTPTNRVGVTQIVLDPLVILAGQSFYFSDRCYVLPTNATNQNVDWHIDFDGGTNYVIRTGSNKMILEPKEGYTPKAGTITLLAQIPNGKENGGVYGCFFKIRVVNDINLQGSAIIPSNPVVGEKIVPVLDGDVKTLYDTTLTWQYKNEFGMYDPVTKIKNYGKIVDDALVPGVGLVGKEIRVKIVSRSYLGAVVSESKVVGKNAIMKTPCGFTCGFSPTSGICAKINSDTHLLQEFVLLKSSTPPTETQWKTLAKYPTSKLDLYFNTDENGDAITGSTTYTIYSRFRATDSSSAGTEIISASYYTGFKCSMEVSSIKLVYRNVEYKPYDTIIIDLQGESSITFRPKVIAGPTNANVWRKHEWKLTGSSAVTFYGVGNSGGSYCKIINSQNGGDEYFTELKATFTSQGKYYLSADIDGSGDKYGYYNIVVIDSTKHIDEYVVSVRPSNITPTSYTVELGKAFIPSFVSTAAIFPSEAQKDYKIVYKEATYKSGSYGVPYTITDNAYIDVDESTGAITGVKKTGSATSEKGYLVLCIYDTTTQKTRIVSGFTISVTEATHTHFLTEVSAKPATCTESGYSKTFYVCSCGKWFSDSAGNNEIKDHSTCIINELDHDYGEFIFEVEPTHYKDGTIGHYHCSRCNKNFDVAKKELQSLVIDHSKHQTDTSKWEHDNDYHWHTCTLDYCTEVLDKAKHTPNAKGDECTICKVVLSKPSETPKVTATPAPEATTPAPETATPAPETLVPATATPGSETATPEASAISTPTSTPAVDDTSENSEGGSVLTIILIIIGLLVLVAIVVIVILVKKKK